MLPNDSSASRTSTSCPASASARAQASPTTPAPITTVPTEKLFSMVDGDRRPDGVAGDFNKPQTRRPVRSSRPNWPLHRRIRHRTSPQGVEEGLQRLSFLAFGRLPRRPHTRGERAERSAGISTVEQEIRDFRAILQPPRCSTPTRCERPVASCYARLQSASTAVAEIGVRSSPPVRDHVRIVIIPADHRCADAFARGQRRLARGNARGRVRDPGSDRRRRLRHRLPSLGARAGARGRAEGIHADGHGGARRRRPRHAALAPLRGGLHARVALVRQRGAPAGPVRPSVARQGASLLGGERHRVHGDAVLQGADAAPAPPGNGRRTRRRRSG